MDLEKRDEGPFTELLIDVGDSFYPSPSGFKYDCVGADGSFNAEEAILDVFGGFCSCPMDVEASSFPVPQPPIHSPSHIFRGGASISEAKNKEQQQPLEIPQTKENQGDASDGIGGDPLQKSAGSFGNQHNNFSHGPPVASSSPFKQQFRSGGFGGPTHPTSTGFGEAPVARPSGFGAPPSTLIPGSNGRGGFGEPPKNLIIGGPSGDCSGFGSKPSASSGGVGGAPGSFNLGGFEDQPRVRSSDSFGRFGIASSGFGTRTGGGGDGTGKGAGEVAASGFKSGGFESKASGSRSGGFGSTLSNNKVESSGSGFSQRCGFGGGQQSAGGFGNQSGGDGFGSPKISTGFKSGGFASAATGGPPAGGFGGASGFGSRSGVGSSNSQSGTGFGRGFGGGGGFSSPMRRGFCGGQERAGGFGRGIGTYRSDSMDFLTPSREGGSGFGLVANGNGAVFSPSTQNALFTNSGFGRTNENIALLPNRRPGSGRSGRGSGRGGSGRRSGRRGGRGRDRSSPSGFSMNKETSSDSPKIGAVEAPEKPKEKAEEPSDFGAKRAAQNFGGDRQPTAESTPKRRRMSCTNCGRPGHLATACYSTQNKDSMRCYNCNQMGHLSVRCPLPRDPNRGRPRAARLPTCSTFAGTASETITSQSQNGSSVTDSPRADTNNNQVPEMGVGLMCKLMQDADVRHEMQNDHPELHDKILVYMLKHVHM